MTTIANTITLDGTFSDWPAQDMIMTAANAVAGYQIYGALLADSALGPTYVIGIDATSSSDPVIGPGTIFYLNTDQNNTTGYNPFGVVGAEYYVQFALDSSNALQPYLYAVDPAGVSTLLNGGAPLAFGLAADGESVELAVPQALLTPSGGAAPTSINFDVLINNGAVALPPAFSGTTPEYVISAGPSPANTIANTITLDGSFADWPAGDMVMTPGNSQAGYQVYGALLNDSTLGAAYVIGVDAINAADPAIAAGSVIYLNTDQDATTGYSPFGKIGAEYEIQFAVGPNSALQPYLYSLTSAGVATLLNGGDPIPFGLSFNGASVEVAIARSLITPTGGAAPTTIDFVVNINNGLEALPPDFTVDPPYQITDPATLASVDHAIKKVGIVYSATTAAQFFGGGSAGATAYSDLFMATQQQARAAGVSYDLLTEADLTNVAKLSQYSALIFPSFQDVQASQAAAIADALSQVVYQHHVPIITAGAFMTNDQNGNPLPGNSYSTMQNLLNLTSGGFGTATYSVTPDATALAGGNPILAGYSAGQLIGGASGEFAGTTQGYYTNAGYTTFSGFTQPATSLAGINIQGGASVAGVVQTTTGGTNTVFATTGLLGDSNLLQHVIQNAVFQTAPGLAIDVTRFKGVVNSRTDMDQSQYLTDVNPSANGYPGNPGIYDKLIPLLQQWKQQYNFVGSYYVTIGDGNAVAKTGTDWTVSTPYYDQILQMGSEMGDHSYTHLISPPAVDASGNPVPTTVVAGATVSTWGENTNTLYVAAPANGSAPNWTYAYEFGQSKTIEQQNIGIAIAGAAVPGANDTLADSQNILPYFSSTAGGVTGYVSGGWTGVGSGAPNAFGYITPGDTQAVYIAPNVTFDFSEVQYDSKSAASALADWENLFNQLSANSATPIIVWPWHDYGPTNWPTGGVGTTPPGYTPDLYQSFIANAFGAGYEFVTSEQLAQRIAAEQAATLRETTSGAVVTATVTPATSQPDLGGMALNVVNGSGRVIQNAGDWYAYDADSVFMPYGGGTFTVTLGATQDDVTHIDSLPMRADLQSVTGDGANLTFAMTGDGTVDVHIKSPSASANVISVQGASVATLVGDDLQLTFNDGPLAISPTSPQGVAVLHTVTITEGAAPVAGAIVFAAPTVTIASSGGFVNAANPILTGTVTEAVEAQVAGTTVTLYDNGVALPIAATVSSTGTWTAAITLSGDGAHSIVAMDTDRANLTGAANAVVYTLVTSAPTVSATQTLTGVTRSASDTITVTASAEAVGGDSIAGVTIFDGATSLGAATAAAGGTWTFTVAGLADGTHAFSAVPTDLAGNSASSALSPVTVATQAPSVAASQSVSGLTNQTSDTIIVTAAAAVAGDSIVGVEIYSGAAPLGAATLSGTTWTYVASGLTDGQSYAFSAVATDAAGNSATVVLAPLTVATQAPAVSAVQTVSGLTRQTSDTITISASAEAFAGDAIAGVEIYNGATDLGAATLGAGGTWAFTASGLADGQAYTFRAAATDSAGNVASTTLAPVMVASQAPFVSASQSVSGPTNQTSDTITVSAVAEAFGGDSIVGVEIYSGATDLGAAVANGGSWTYTASGLIDGTYAFTAVATDAAGNTASTTLAPVTVATQAPRVSATETVSGLTNLTSNTITAAVIAGAAGAAIQGVEVFNGTTDLGAATAGPAGTWTYMASNLADGVTTFRVVATDAAGNTASTTLAPVMVATQAPALSATESISGVTNQTVDVITGTAVAEAVGGDSITGVEIFNGSTDLGAASLGVGGAWAFTANGLALGQTYLFRAVARDAAGQHCVGHASRRDRRERRADRERKRKPLGRDQPDHEPHYGDGDDADARGQHHRGRDLQRLDRSRGGHRRRGGDMDLRGRRIGRRPDLRLQRGRPGHHGSDGFGVPGAGDGGDAGPDRRRDGEPDRRDEPDFGHDHGDGDRRGGRRRPHPERRNLQRDDRPRGCRARRWRNVGLHRRWTDGRRLRLQRGRDGRRGQQRESDAGAADGGAAAAGGKRGAKPVGAHQSDFGRDRRDRLVARGRDRPDHQRGDLQRRDRSRRGDARRRRGVELHGGTSA